MYSKSRGWVHSVELGEWVLGVGIKVSGLHSHA